MLPAKSLQDRVAIITGGGTGIGKAIALKYAELGAKIVIASRKKEVLDQAAMEIGKKGTEVLAVPTDVRIVDQVNNMVAQTVDRFGRLDILVNNAAGNFVCPSLDLTPNGWNAVVGIVLNGTWFCSQAAAKAMISSRKPGEPGVSKGEPGASKGEPGASKGEPGASKGEPGVSTPGGNILNIIATYAWTGGPGTAPSAASKAAVLNLTQTLAVEWAQHKIRVNAIAPGPIATENTTRQLFGGGNLIDKISRDIPLGHFGTVEDIADAAAYLVSDYANYITGANLTIDGGGWLNKGFLKYASS